MNKNRAFTLGEVIIVFVIIGIIASIAMSIIKPFEKAYKYSYTKIFNALSTAIYNHMTTVPGVDAFPEDPGAFCNALISFINTSNNAENSATTNPCNLTGEKDDFLGGEPTIDDFTGGKNPKIRLSNGAWLWIGADSKDGGLVPFSYTQTIGTTTDTVKYYIVYADLNGDRGPNRIANADAANASHLPDIVAFAVTDSFAVIPLGYPKLDQRYLSAHIMYPVTEEDDEISAEGERPSGSMTYYEAIVGAYGKSPNKIVTYGIAQTYDIESGLSDNNPFKLTENLDDFYAEAPVFDQQICGDGKSVEDIVSENRDSHCDVKVFNYN